MDDISGYPNLVGGYPKHSALGCPSTVSWFSWRDFLYFLKSHDILGNTGYLGVKGMSLAILDSYDQTTTISYT